MQHINLLLTVHSNHEFYFTMDSVALEGGVQHFCFLGWLFFFFGGVRNGHCFLFKETKIDHAFPDDLCQNIQIYKLLFYSTVYLSQCSFLVESKINGHNIHRSCLRLHHQFLLQAIKNIKILQWQSKSTATNGLRRKQRKIKKMIQADVLIPAWATYLTSFLGFKFIRVWDKTMSGIVSRLIEGLCQ